MLILFLALTGLAGIGAACAAFRSYASLLAQIPHNNADFQCFVIEDVRALPVATRKAPRFSIIPAAHAA